MAKVPPPGNSQPDVTFNENNFGEKEDIQVANQDSQPNLFTKIETEVESSTKDIEKCSNQERNELTAP